MIGFCTQCISINTLILLKIIPESKTCHRVTIAIKSVSLSNQPNSTAADCQPDMNQAMTVCMDGKPVDSFVIEGIAEVIQKDRVHL